MNPADRNVTAIIGRLAHQNKQVGESLTVRSFRAGETVCEAKEMARSVFLIASGRVQLYRTTRDGRRFVLATLGPGSMFGENSLLGGEGPDTYAVALEPCTIWVMPRQRALEISSTDAMFGFEVDRRALGDKNVRMSITRIASILRKAATETVPIAGPWVRTAPLTTLVPSAPYLHNGSVPTLRALLEPTDRRPVTFQLGQGQGTFTFDTRLPGNRNTGHEFGTKLTDQEKADLVAFLESL